MVTEQRVEFCYSVVSVVGAAVIVAACVMATMRRRML